MKCSLNPNRRRAGAIRLLDVAAILSVVAVLAVLALLGASRFHEHALRAQCRGNLRQIAEALQLYANVNDGLLPDCSAANPSFAGSVWPWDYHTNLVNALEADGATRESFYCPANPKMNDDRHWNFWRANPTPMRIVSYPTLFVGVAQVPANLWRRTLASDPAHPPAQTELAFDATACVGDNYARIEGTWTDRSNHMRDKKPRGGNVLFLDGHVDWRDFGKMENRFSTIGPAGVVYWSY